ncbi:MAG: formylglycine-generating enzyme family protein [Gammaproteobacteria bacterium]|nr:formylglycine-generating enzyme family protein [Gammaproteobacteria bacterium]MBU1653811.1 formylglycine-generating enzyme family protein [Gammaproteobacteria bacterium]MBU1961723.1 formylglycine-generating enzyme family protein [Gammaproteobacteria bacterium]
MISPALLGSLSNLHHLMMNLAEQMPDADFNRQYHPELGSFGHILAQCVYRELYWLREAIMGDADLSGRVQRLVSPGELSLGEQCAQLPPKDHLLNWAAEIQDHHLMLLANPKLLPAHPLLENDAILHFIVQEQARSYEGLLSLLSLRQIQGFSDDYCPKAVLESRPPTGDAVDVTQGVYRIGSRFEPWAYDNELPPQMMKLSNFRIALRPVSNAEYLSFIEDGGYERESLWWRGCDWLKTESAGAPMHWRRDASGHWYGIGLNGPFDLIGEEPVYGINHYETSAYAVWASERGGETAGAVLQHEYQWETALRTQVLENHGRVWEWCANPFEPYSEYQPPAELQRATPDFDGEHRSLRGGCLHTQPAIRRPSFRNRGLPHQQFLFTGARLVFPPRVG